MTDLATIACDQFYPYPTHAVWRALTEPELFARWWVPGDIRPIVGHRFTLDMGSWGAQPCEVTKVEPERLLVFTFAEGDLNSTLSWRLEPEGSGTRLFLEHSGLDRGTPLGRQAYAGMGAGWPKVLATIEGVLAG
ncbi:SRPBCC domain-containing protein [Planctomonas sp. JC2975]|uniref:SRPBCC family protein n=1 Tax=Planctomonas sp. JC2975 TaxID=2729626 RepID=UPI001473D891|nr:SRPBCC domain-containing protein [Planctomonas sp. JC2975]NNC12506.1 SRPBCC domain-containing protein [Planctomonas sp. JC2975]